MCSLYVRCYVISREEKLSAHRVAFLNRCGLDVVRIDPVFLEDRELGCYHAHRNAWKLVVAHGEKCMVMEEDWEPAASAVHIAGLLQQHAGTKGVVRFGHFMDLGISYAATAYLMAPEDASAALQEPVNVVDHMSWCVSAQSVPGDSVPGLFGHGVFQQNRKQQDSMAIHDELNYRYDQQSFNNHRTRVTTARVLHS